jgi:hypothetical protein
MPFGDQFLEPKRKTPDGKTLVCACGHTARTHNGASLMPGMMPPCTMGVMDCMCPDFQPVLTVTDGRVFRFARDVEHGRHPLERGIAKVEAGAQIKVRTKPGPKSVLDHDGTGWAYRPVEIEYLPSFKCWVSGCGAEAYAAGVIPLGSGVEKHVIVCSTHYAERLQMLDYDQDLAGWWINDALEVRRKGMPS